MNFLNFFIFVPLVHSASHTFMTTYTETHGQGGISEISAVSTLDGREIDYYDSQVKKLIPKQDWMQVFASSESWKNFTNMRERVQETNKLNLRFLMEQFHHLHDVHTYKRIYGCDWDDRTGHSNWFDQHTYDGEDFISLDVENNRYHASVPQAFNTMNSWNENRHKLAYLRKYYKDECVGWVLYLQTRGPKETSFSRLMHVIYVLIAIVIILAVLNTGTKVLACKISEICMGFLTVSLIVCSAEHSFRTLYSEMNLPDFPEISSLTTLDGQHIDYYDSEIKKLIPRQDWMKEFISGDRFVEYTEIREHVQQTNKVNLTVLMEIFNQSHGVHTYQRMYGCGWDDQTGKSYGFDYHGYDGEDFVSLDLTKLLYITVVPEGLITIDKWNNDRVQLEFLWQFYQHKCVSWLKYFLKLREADLEIRAPQVSLLQKNPSSPVLCQATGFYPAAMTFSWLRNGQDVDEDVDLGELLPNEDGTFQQTSALRLLPDESEKNQYFCVVEHQTKTIRKILSQNEIKSNINNWYTRYLCVVDHKVKDHPEDSD
ncbi:LOW QUALITY PROTEIN: major histocompatibility complex class I-related gene protein-like [Puntigrus tetrazona]|uniref:LOW QUALITY PROTEIN: major histocompatibility complex class I-related gene protein-like n=1 Tax=Puntigrus tetrazona TaxID=1606681 RepID=UPI001C89547D|nr:LOW QUALITY PROTEIN: major histocompatibility complex class I-related gene protein-like [Puntigrus tetrazona]